MVPSVEKGLLYMYTCYSLREHPVFPSLVWWFHIRIHNRQSQGSWQSLKYYRLFKTSWKIHENIALSFNDKPQGFLLMLIESFELENFPFFPVHLPPHFSTRLREIHATSSNMQGELWLVSNSWRHGNLFSTRFRRQFFSASETKAETEPDALADKI